MDNRGGVVDNRGGEGMVSKRGSSDNGFNSFHNRLGDNGGGGSKSIVVGVQVVGIRIGRSIGISRVGIGGVRVGGVRIGGVGRRITIVIVVVKEVGISLGLSISLGFSLSFSLTAFSANNSGGAIGGSGKAGGESSSQSTASLGDAVMGSEADNGSGVGKGSRYNSGGMVHNGSYSMVVSREGEGNGGSMDGVRNLSGNLDN